MRAALIFTSLALMAGPALAQSAPVAPAPIADISLPPELSDPAFADRLVDAMDALSDAFLDLPVGKVQAAVEGRKPTSADKRRTVRTETRMSERQLKAQIEQSRPVLKAGMKAMVAALPAMMRGMTDAAREIEKATANLPSPTYPNR